MNGFTVSESDLTVRLGFGVENELLSVANSNSLITNYLPVKQFVQMAGEGGFCVLCTFYVLWHVAPTNNQKQKLNVRTSLRFKMQDQ